MRDDTAQGKDQRDKTELVGTEEKAGEDVQCIQLRQDLAQAEHQAGAQTEP